MPLYSAFDIALHRFPLVASTNAAAFVHQCVIYLAPLDILC